MVDFLQFVLLVLLVFTAGVWVGATGLHAVQQEQKRRQIEQEAREWAERQWPEN